MRFYLEVAYDGTNYSGFQCQNNAVAIQDILNAALSDLFGTPVKTTGASRTDAGVHSRGNVCIFDVETRIKPSRIRFALNTRLPEDIRVMKSLRCADDFHPLRCSSVKTYRYRIWNGVIEDPTKRLYYTHFHYPLDIDKMNEAASCLIGEHDFASFCAAGFTGDSTVRTIYESHVERCGDEVIYTISGNGFLYNMVRIIAGTLIRIGNGKWDASYMKTVIEGKDRELAGDTAPAKGLTLEKIEYNANDMKLTDTEV